MLWEGLWHRLGVSDGRPAEYDELVARYSEPHRFYHTLAHHDHVVEEFLKVCDLAKNPCAVELALRYHDIVYDPRAKDNEERSWLLARGVMMDAGLSEEFAEVVKSIILATKHDALPVDKDARLAVDIDLSILGQAESVFDQYEHDIRLEYAWVPIDLYRTVRSQILKQFLDRSSVYQTPRLREMYETRARKNLMRSIACLGNYSKDT
jgi:predicted metal-dependent HD superfamily phosphohydrolase